MSYRYGYNSRVDRCPLCDNYLGEKEVKKLMEREPEAEILGSKLFLDKEFVDLKIICEGKEFECHKNVLCCQINYTQSLLMRTTAKWPTLGVLKNSSNLDAQWCLILQV